jgi:uncharacterized membrane protein YvlD (DUF360 family)
MDAIRRLLLTFFINASAVVITTSLLPGFSYSGGFMGIITITLVLAGVNLLIRPALSLLELPVEIATVAIISLFVNAGMLLLLANTIVGFSILPFPFPGILRGSFLIAPFTMPAFGTAIMAAILIALLVAALSWLTGLGGHKGKHH